MKFLKFITIVTALSGTLISTAQITVDSTGKVAVGYSGAISNQMMVHSNLSDPGQFEQFNVYQLYGISSTDTDYIKAIDIKKYNYDIPSGVSSNGYQIGLASQVYVSDTNFEGVISQQYAIWARTGIYTAGATGERRVDYAYGIYLDGLSSAGTITNHYGVYQRGAGTKNYFEGNVGIGTSSPTAGLHVSDGASSSPAFKVWSTESGGDGWLQSIGPYAHISADNAGSHYISWGAYFDGATNQWMRSYTGLPLVSLQLSTSGDFAIKTDPTSSGSPNWATRFYVNESGNVGIGTTSPTEKLHVVGKIRATSYISDTLIYADFVFDPDYELPSLSSVKAHIEEHGHLPDIPSEAEAMEQGIDLGVMQVRLLQKIEELTLHQIRQQEEIDELKIENRDLRSVL